MSRPFNTAKNIFAGFGLIIFLAIAAFFIVAMWRAPIHQFNLWMLERNFKAVSSHHPENSRYVLKVRDFGNLFRGASNGCDYLVGEMRVGKGSQEEIARYYHGLFIKSFDNTGSIPVEVHFFDKEENWMDPYHWSDWRDRAQAYIESAALDGTPYMVFARQDGYPPYGDMRCG